MALRKLHPTSVVIHMENKVVRKLGLVKCLGFLHLFLHQSDAHAMTKKIPSYCWYRTEGLAFLSLVFPFVFFTPAALLLAAALHLAFAFARPFLRLRACPRTNNPCKCFFSGTLFSSAGRSGHHVSTDLWQANINHQTQTTTWGFLGCAVGCACAKPFPTHPNSNDYKIRNHQKTMKLLSYEHRPTLC